MSMTAADHRDPTRVAVIGAGLISRYHLEALAASPDVDLVALVARTPERATVIAAEYAIPHVLDEWAALPGMADAVVIATPDDTHVEIAKGLVARGVAVLVQKPVAPSAEEAHALVHLASQGRVSASFMHRHLDGTVALERLLREGVLGEVMSARIRNATPGPDWSAWFFRADGPIAGVVGQLGVHGIDLVQHLLGDIVTVQAASAIRKNERQLRDGSRVRSTVPDHVHALYRLENGALVSHEQVWAEAGGTDRFRMEVHGAHASAFLSSPSGPLVVHRGNGRSEEIPLEREAVLGRRHHDAWLSAVRDGRDDGTTEDAWRGLRIAEAITAAAASGETIRLRTESPSGRTAHERSSS